MLRTVIIIVVLCAGLAVLLTAQAPQREGTLTLKPAPTFPEDRKADLGRAIARIVPHCPGLARYGSEAAFTDFSGDAANLRITFTMPELPTLPADWGRFDAPCVYAVDGGELRIAEPACQALCLGKKPEHPLDELEINLNSQQQPQK